MEEDLGKVYRKKMRELESKYASTDFQKYHQGYKALKKEYDIEDRWYGYCSFVDDCIYYKHFELGAKEWNNLMNEQYDTWHTFMRYHEFFLHYPLKLEFELKRPIINGHNVIGMGGWTTLTDFGKDRIKEIEGAIEELILKEGSFYNLIWDDYNFDVDFKHSMQLLKDTGINRQTFYEKCEKVATDLGRTAENYFRKNIGVPAIGEGWVSETHLFYEIKNRLDCEVIHHGKPKWLGRQHFDIWIPSLNVAIEYQGTQHDKPVDFFGGEKAFKENQKRDKKKRELCLKHNVRLIEVRKGYVLQEIIDEIQLSYQ